VLPDPPAPATPIFSDRADLPGPITCTSVFRSLTAHLETCRLHPDVERTCSPPSGVCPTCWCFSWRDIQIYAPVGGRGGNPLQNSLRCSTPPITAPLRGGWVACRLMGLSMGALAQTSLCAVVSQGPRFNPEAAGGARCGAGLSVSTNSWQGLPKGTWSPCEGEVLLGN